MTKIFIIAAIAALLILMVKGTLPFSMSLVPVLAGVWIVLASSYIFKLTSK